MSNPPDPMQFDGKPTVKINVNKERDGDYVDKVMIGRWIIYSVEGGKGIAMDNLYHIDNGECFAIGEQPSAVVRMQDLWVIRRRIKQAETAGWGCEGCGCEFSSPDSPPLELYGVSRSGQRETISKAPSAYVVCTRCALIMTRVTRLMEFEKSYS